ncbi:hypothetical protein [Streptomyces sp. NPDC086023]|uniref:hypothetical protein n=1 Tax=Streptomyces sp. NPDC086023 TaxID=3365746 RepID=UPI0037D6CE85
MDAVEKDVLKKDLEATLQTRRDLGPEYEPALVESFLDKVDVQLTRRLAEQRVAAARGTDQGPDLRGFGARYGFAALSLVLAVPLSAIGVANAGIGGLLVAWGGILGVNFCAAAKSWRRDAQD